MLKNSQGGRAYLPWGGAPLSDRFEFLLFRTSEAIPKGRQGSSRGPPEGWLSTRTEGSDQLSKVTQPLCPMVSCAQAFFLRGVPTAPPRGGGDTPGPLENF